MIDEVHTLAFGTERGGGSAMGVVAEGWVRWVDSESERCRLWRCGRRELHVLNQKDCDSIEILSVQVPLLPMNEAQSDERLLGAS